MTTIQDGRGDKPHTSIAKLLIVTCCPELVHFGDAALARQLHCTRVTAQRNTMRDVRREMAVQSE